MHDVHWNEGMLLLPQHLQLFRSFLLERTSAAAMQRVGVGAYGVRALEWGLTDDSIGVVAADLTLPCGTLVRIPDECTVPAAPIAAALAEAPGPVDVWLGVPLERVGLSVVASEENRSGRYLIQRARVRDEADGGTQSERDVLVRRLNVRLFIGDAERDGFSCLRVAQLRRRSDLESDPQFVDEFVPPLLDVTADAGLRRRLRALCNVLRAKNESLGRHVSSQPFALALQTGADPEQIFKLDALNTHVGAIEQLCLTKGVHPFDTYLALCRLAGALALFSNERVCPVFPSYDHGQLGPCFGAVSKQLETYIDTAVREHYVRREFTPGATGELECRLASEWLQVGSNVYLAAISESVKPEALDSMLGQQVKLFGLRDEAAKLMVAGIRLLREVRNPAALPERHNVHYYRLDREATPSARWSVVQATEAVQLKFEGAPPTDVRFELFAVPRK